MVSIRTSARWAALGALSVSLAACASARTVDRDVPSASGAGIPSSRASAGAAQPGAEAAPDSTRFQQQVLVQGSLDEPTELAVTRDGRIFFTERKGALKVYEPERAAARVVARLEVFTENENGLMGLALDPGFDRTGWLYLNRTVGDTLDIRYRVSRFTYTGEGLADEKVLLEVPATRGCCHTGGSMTFDGRGNLLVSFGDNTNPFATRYAPIDASPGRELHDARRSSANTQDLRGKILRITPQPDGTYTIPPGNLFTDPGEGRPEIYTMGHRNPYRISVDRRTGFLYWGEVGPDARIDSVFGPKGYDEVNQARRAGNFGWPLFIADNQRYRDRDFATGRVGELFDPERPVNDSPNNTGARILPPAQPALIWYPYDASEEFPLTGEGGRNAMAGPVYYSGDFPGSAVRLPAYYDGKLIHYDWIRGWMRAVTMDEQGDFVKMEPFLEHLEFDHPIDVELGPDGSLYVLEYGTFWFAPNPTARLSRIVYHSGNRPPVARLTVDRTVGAAPLTVRLSARESMDHDTGDALRYTWLLGEGASAEGPAVEHTFAQPGTHAARLVVTDPSGAADTASAEIRVGNAPPEVRLVVEGNRSFFWGAGPLNYHVEVSDAEDGALGRGIDPQRVRVTLDYLAKGLQLQPSTEPGHQTERTPVGLALMRESDCMSCHAAEQASIGPSFRMIAERYAGQPDAVQTLASRVIQGTSGAWGDRIMPAHASLRQDVAREMVRYIVSLASSGDVLPTSGAIRLDRHQAGESGAYVLTATYVDQARNGIGPLEGRREVVLRAPRIPAAQVSATRGVEMVEGPAADGTERPLASVQTGDAHLHLGPLDLTGVREVRLRMQSQGRSFALELRAGGPDGVLLAAQEVRAPAAGSWFEAALPLRTTGERDLYVVFRSAASGVGEDAPLVRVDDLHFQGPGS